MFSVRFRMLSVRRQMLSVRRQMLSVLRQMLLVWRKICQLHSKCFQWQVKTNLSDHILSLDTINKVMCNAPVPCTHHQATNNICVLVSTVYTPNDICVILFNIDSEVHQLNTYAGILLPGPMKSLITRTIGIRIRITKRLWIKSSHHSERWHY